MIRALIVFFAIFNFALISQPNSWQKLSLPGFVSEIFVTENNIIYASSFPSVYKTTDLGNTWQTIFISKEYCSSARLKLYIDTCYPGNDRIIVKQNNYQICINPPVFISIDGGQNWTEFSLAGNQFNYLSFDSKSTIYISSDSLYSSKDNGLTWAKINIPLGENNISKMVTDTDDNIYLSKFGSYYENFEYYSWETVYKSTDFGKDWIIAFGTQTGKFSTLENLFTAPGGHIFASYAQPAKFYHYHNGITQIYPLSWTMSAIVEGNNIYTVNLNVGISYSTDSGVTWNINNELPTKHIFCIAKDNDGYLFAGTDSGLYKSNYTITQPVDVNETNYVTDFNLSQNYPNPFNSSTIIEYSVPELSNVELTIFNYLGQLIASPVNEQKDRGSYRITFSPDNLSSGIYFYRIQAQGKFICKKLILLK